MRYHIRRKELEINDENILKKILKITKYVTIALAIKNQPYLVSLSHGFDESENCIYFHCAVEGKKVDYMKENNTIWGQALIDGGYVDGECSHLYASVMFEGIISFIEDPTEKWEAISLMTRQLDNAAETLIAERTPESLKDTVIGRIDIKHMTGKKSDEFNV
jgi:nitroimidazol reductase NimA-like FMN-containing flavoprotein (pyridoxamine 5'-phosphate oxidase superfamily)